MTDTTAIGRTAETAAAAYLQKQGMTIIDRNWRNRWCEIDIVARRGDIIHFVEVKYRRTISYGAGYEHINRDKAARLTRAALAWCQARRFSGDYQIDAISFSGSLEQPLIEYLPSIIGF